MKLNPYKALRWEKKHTQKKKKKMAKNPTKQIWLERSY